MRTKLFLNTVARVLTNDLPFRWAITLFTLTVAVSFFTDDKIDWKSAFIIGGVPFVIAMFFTLAGHALGDGLFTYIRENKTTSGQTIALIGASLLIGRDAHLDATKQLNKHKEKANG